MSCKIDKSIQDIKNTLDVFGELEGKSNLEVAKEVLEYIYDKGTDEQVAALGTSQEVLNLSMMDKISILGFAEELAKKRTSREITIEPTVDPDDIIHDDITPGVKRSKAEHLTREDAYKEAKDAEIGNSENTSKESPIDEEDLNSSSTFMNAFTSFYFNGAKNDFVKEFKHEMSLKVKTMVMGLSKDENGEILGPTVNVTNRYNKLLNKWRISSEALKARADKDGNDFIEEAFKSAGGKDMRIMYYEHLMYSHFEMLVDTVLEGLVISPDYTEDGYSYVKGGKGIKVKTEHQEELEEYLNHDLEFNVSYDGLSGFLASVEKNPQLELKSEDGEISTVPIFLRLKEVPKNLTYDQFNASDANGLKIHSDDDPATYISKVSDGDVFMYIPGKGLQPISPKHKLLYSKNDAHKEGHENDFDGFNNDSDFIKFLLKTTVRLRSDKKRRGENLMQDRDNPMITEMEYYSVNVALSGLVDKSKSGIRTFLKSKFNEGSNKDESILYRSIYYAFYADTEYSYINTNEETVSAISLNHFASTGRAYVHGGKDNVSIAKNMINAFGLSLSKETTGRTFFRNDSVSIKKPTSIVDIALSIPSYINNVIFKDAGVLFKDISSRISIKPEGDYRIGFQLNKKYNNTEIAVSAIISIVGGKPNIEVNKDLSDPETLQEIFIALEMDEPFTNLNFIKNIDLDGRVKLVTGLITLVTFKNEEYIDKIQGYKKSIRETFENVYNDQEAINILRPTMDTIGKAYKDIQGVSSPSYFYTGNNTKTFKFVNVSRESKLKNVTSGDTNQYQKVGEELEDTSESMYDYNQLVDGDIVSYEDRYQKDGIEKNGNFYSNSDMTLQHRLVRSVEGNFLGMLVKTRGRNVLIQPMVYSDRSTIFEYMLKVSSDIDFKNNSDGFIKKLEATYKNFYRRKYASMQKNVVDNWLRFLIHEGVEYSDNEASVNRIITKYSKYSKDDYLNNNITGEMVRDIAAMNLSYEAVSRSQYLVRNLIYSPLEKVIRGEKVTVAVPTNTAGIMSAHLSSDERIEKWMNSNVNNTIATYANKFDYTEMSERAKINSKIVFGKELPFKTVMKMHFLLSAPVQDSALDVLLSPETEFSSNAESAKLAYSGHDGYSLTPEQYTILEVQRSSNFMKQSKRVQSLGTRGLEPQQVRAYKYYAKSLPLHDLARGMEGKLSKLPTTGKLESRFYRALHLGIFSKLSGYSAVDADTVMMTYAGYKLLMRIDGKKLVFTEDIQEVLAKATVEEISDIITFVEGLNKFNWKVPSDLTLPEKGELDSVLKKHRDVDLTGRIIDKLHDDEGEHGIELGTYSNNILIDEDAVGGPTSLLSSLGMSKWMSQDSLDGVQWGHPLYFIRLTAGTGIDFSSFGSQGSAVKDLTQVRNPYTGELILQKKSTQNIFSNEILLDFSNERLHNMFKIMNTRIKFPPVDIEVPSTDAEGNDITVTMQFANMHELWKHFGSFYNPNSWHEVAEVLAENPIIRESYVEKFGFTSGQKTGVRGVTDVKAMLDNTYDGPVPINEVSNENHVLMLQKLHASESSEAVGKASQIAVPSQFISAMLFEGRTPENALNVTHGVSMLTNINIIEFYIDLLNTLKADPDFLNLEIDMPVTSDMPLGKKKFSELNYAEINFDLISDFEHKVLDSNSVGNLKRELYSVLANKWMKDGFIEERDSETYKKLIEGDPKKIPYMSYIMRQKSNSVIRSQIYKKLTKITFPGVIAVTSPSDFVTSMYQTSEGRFPRAEAIVHRMFSRNVEDIAKTFSVSYETYVELVNSGKLLETDKVLVRSKGIEKGEFIRGGMIEGTLDTKKIKSIKYVDMNPRKSDIDIDVDLMDSIDKLTTPGTIVWVDAESRAQLINSDPDLYSATADRSKVQLLSDKAMLKVGTDGEYLYNIDLIVNTDPSNYKEFENMDDVVHMDLASINVASQVSEAHVNQNILEEAEFLKDLKLGKISPDYKLLTDTQINYIGSELKEELISALTVDGDYTYSIITPDNSIYISNDIEELTEQIMRELSVDPKLTFKLYQSDGINELNSPEDLIKLTEEFIDKFSKGTLGKDSLGDISREYLKVKQSVAKSLGENKIDDDEWVRNKVTGKIDKAFYARMKYGNLSAYEIYTDADGDLKFYQYRVAKKPNYTGIFVNTDYILKKYTVTLPNVFADHSVITSGDSAKVEDVKVGMEETIKVKGRLTTSNVDLLLLEDTGDKIKNQFILLGTAENMDESDAIKAILDYNMSGIGTFEALDDSFTGTYGINTSEGKIVTDKDAYTSMSKEENYIENYVMNRDLELYIKKYRGGKKFANETQIITRKKELLGELRIFMEENEVEIIPSEVYANNFNLEAFLMTIEDKITDVIGFSKYRELQLLKAKEFFFKRLKNKGGKLYSITLTSENLDTKILFLNRSIVKAKDDDKRGTYKDILKIIRDEVILKGADIDFEALNKKIATEVQRRNSVNINVRAQKMAESFIEALQIMPPRIPGQGKQAGYTATIKGFIHSNKNALYSSREAYINTGKDNDIDTDNVLTRAISENGVAYKYDKYLLGERDANGNLKDLNANHMIKDKNDENIIFKQELLELEILVKAQLDEYNILAESLGDTIMSEVEIAAIVTKKVKAKIKQFKGAVQNYTIDNMHTIMNSKNNIVEVQTPVSMATLKLTIENSNKENIIEGYDFEKEGISTHNGAWLYSTEHLNMEGSDGISDFANAQRAYAAIIAVQHEVGRPLQLGSGTYTTFSPDFVEKNAAINGGDLIHAVVDENGKYSLPEGVGFGLNIPNDDKTGMSTLVVRDTFANMDSLLDQSDPKYRARLKKHLGKNQAWEILSQLLSAATDNAKELLLGKINANSDTNSIISTMIILGFEFNQVYRFLTQKEVTTILDGYTQTKNRFEEYSLNKYITEFHADSNVGKELKDLLKASEGIHDFRRVLTLSQNNRIRGFDLHKVLKPLYKGLNDGENILDELQSYKKDSNKYKEFKNKTGNKKDQQGEIVSPLFYIMNHPTSRALLRSTFITTNAVDAVSEIDALITKRMYLQKGESVSEDLSMEIEETLNEAVIEAYVKNKVVTLPFNNSSRRYKLGNRDQRAEFIYSIHRSVDYIKKHLKTNSFLNALEVEAPRKDKSKRIVTLPGLGDAENFTVSGYKTALDILKNSSSSEDPMLDYEVKNLRNSLFLYSLILDKGKEKRSSLTALFPTEYSQYNLDTADIKFGEESIIHDIFLNPEKEIIRKLIMPNELRRQPLQKASRPMSAAMMEQYGLDPSELNNLDGYGLDEGIDAFDYGQQEEDVDTEFKGRYTYKQRAVDPGLIGKISGIDVLARFNHPAIENNVYTTLVGKDYENLKHIPIVMKRIHNSDTIAFDTTDTFKVNFNGIDLQLQEGMSSAGFELGIDAIIDRGVSGKVLGFDETSYMYLVYVNNKLEFRSDFNLELLNPTKVFFGHDFRDASISELGKSKKFHKSWRLNTFRNPNEYNKEVKSKHVLIDSSGKVASITKNKSVRKDYKQEDIYNTMDFVFSDDLGKANEYAPNNRVEFRGNIANMLEAEATGRSINIEHSIKHLLKTEYSSKEIYSNSSNENTWSKITPLNSNSNVIFDRVHHGAVASEMFSKLSVIDDNLTLDKVTTELIDILTRSTRDNINKFNIVTASMDIVKERAKNLLDNNLVKSLDLDILKKINNKYCK